MKRQTVKIQHDIDEIVFKFVRNGIIERTVLITNAQGLRDGNILAQAYDGDIPIEHLKLIVALNPESKKGRGID